MTERLSAVILYPLTADRSLLGHRTATHAYTPNCHFASKAVSLRDAQCMPHAGNLCQRRRGALGLNQNKKIMALACERLAREQMVSFEDFL